MVVSYRRNFELPKELKTEERKQQFGKSVENFKKAADRFGTAMFMGPENNGAIPLVPVAKLGEDTKLDPSQIRDGYAAAMAQSRSHHAKKPQSNREPVKIDFPCERLPTPPETDYENYDSEEEERKKKAREEEEIKKKMRPKSSNHTKAAFGAGKHILNRMQKEGWTVAPGGQLIKAPKDVPKAAPRTGPLKVKTQESMDGKPVMKPEIGEPPAKATRIEPKIQKPVPVEPEKESEVEEFEIAESEPEPAGFSMKNELKKLKKEKDEKKAKEEGT